MLRIPPTETPAFSLRSTRPGFRLWNSTTEGKLSLRRASVWDRSAPPWVRAWTVSWVAFSLLRAATMCLSIATAWPVWTRSWRIFERALLVRAILSQLRLGFAFGEVMISTIWVLQSSESRGAMAPLIFAPRQCAPTSEWMANAKSIGVEPEGNSIISPFGVKTNMESPKNSCFISSR